MATWNDIINGEDGSSVRIQINNFNTTATTEINNNTTNLSNLTTTVNNNINNITTNINDIATNVTNIATNVTNIDINTTDIATNVIDITNLQNNKMNNSVTVLNATSLVDQNPVGLDTPLQVEFGAAQVGTDISIDAVGNITFNTTGYYVVEFNASYGRTTTTGSSLLMGRFLLDTVQVGNTIGHKLDNAANSSPYNNFTMGPFIAGQVLSLEIYRDSAGANDGGLLTSVSTLGWGTTPSASIKIYKI